MRSARNARLNAVVNGAEARLRYPYGFGDDWEHEIVVEKVLPPQPGTPYPICLTGKRDCPPEDCGGAWGYEELLETLRDPQHEEHEERLEWVGGAFDAEAFDLDAVNAALRLLH